MNRLSIFSPAAQTALLMAFIAIPVAMGTRQTGAREASLAEQPPATLPLKFSKGEKIALVGGSTAERMNLFGHLETMIHLKHADKELVIRNFGRPADEVGIRQRSADYTKIDDPLAAFAPDTFICFFGFNESFAGQGGLAKYMADYEKFLDEYAGKYARGASKAAPRFVLVAPVAFEPTGSTYLPKGESENANLKLYAKATAEVAAKRKLPVVDIFEPTRAAFEAKPGMQHTINGCHLNDSGDRLVAEHLMEAMLGSGKSSLPAPGSPNYEKLRAAVNDKSWVHSQDYRMVNGWYVYGGRRTFDKETFPKEYAKIRAMAAVRDRYCHNIAQGKTVGAKPDDSGTGELFVPPTRFGEPRQKYSEAESLRYLTPDQFIKETAVPAGLEIKLFADETKFPDIAKPVQLNFDNKGRLWVSCMPSYPQWKPGDPRPGDKLVILEDTDGDGKADKSKVFYDQLHCPTGFEFFGGGVLARITPRAPSRTVPAGGSTCSRGWR